MILNRSRALLPFLSSLQQQRYMLQRNMSSMTAPAPKRAYLATLLQSLKSWYSLSQQQYVGLPLLTSENRNTKLGTLQTSGHHKEQSRRFQMLPITVKRAIQGSEMLALMQSSVFLNPEGSMFQLFSVSCQVWLQVFRKDCEVVSRAQAHSLGWQNIKADLLYMSAAYSMTALDEVLQSPLKTMSGANWITMPRPMKITIKTITKTWNMQTYREFSLQMPYNPSAPPPIMARERPREIPSMVHFMEELPRKMASLKVTQIVPMRRPTPKSKTKSAPREVKHLMIGFIYLIMILPLKSEMKIGW